MFIAVALPIIVAGFFVVEAVPYTVGCLAESLDSIH